MTPDEAIFAKLQEGSSAFLALVAEVRPDLHRYCARMTGSIADGEDVVQDTLARAYYELAQEVAADESCAPDRALARDDRVDDWLLVPGWLGEREVLAVFRGPEDARLGYFIEHTRRGGLVAAIRDFR